MRSPAIDRRQRERQLDAHERLQAREAGAARRLERVGRNVAQPLDHVAIEDQERVRDERDLDGRCVTPVNGTSSWKSARLGIV